MNPRLLRPVANSLDPDAAVYLNAVAQADGQQLEPAVRKAVNDFVRGCKADGIWSAIKASCILAGARTLAGALTPLVGGSPTNNNFVSGDYDRKTGLAGDGSTKYINSNRASGDDPQDNQHMAAYVSTAATSTATTFPFYFGVGAGANGASHMFRNVSNGLINTRHRSFIAAAVGGSGSNTGALGLSRANSAGYDRLLSGSVTNVSMASQTPVAGSIFIFAGSSTTSTPITNSHSNARIAFYSIGEAISLAQLDSRLATLIAAIGAAI